MSYYSRDGHFDIESLFNFMKTKTPCFQGHSFTTPWTCCLNASLSPGNKLGHNPAQYEKTYRSGQHDHLIDTESGRIIEFSDPRINDIIRSACSKTRSSCIIMRSMFTVFRKSVRID
jgi:Fur family ferric uptake transcriptional regulator